MTTKKQVEQDCKVGSSNDAASLFATVSLGKTLNHKMFTMGLKAS